MKKLNLMEKACCAVLRSGAVPEHIGFIMDGNRRFAKKNSFESTLKGHQQGVESLKKTLLFSKQIGVKMISLFCFSIENFKRSKEEVDGLMALVLSTFNIMSSMSKILLDEEIKVNIVGQVKLLRKDVKEALEEVSSRTKDFNKMEINLCFAYDGITESQNALDELSKDGDYEQFFSRLEIQKPLDILVRTANENRLSNFMLAQTQFALICIFKETWPEMGLMSFAKIIFEFNYYFKPISERKAAAQLQKVPSEQDYKQE